MLRVSEQPWRLQSTKQVLVLLSFDRCITNLSYGFYIIELLKHAQLNRMMVMLFIPGQDFHDWASGDTDSVAYAKAPFIDLFRENSFKTAQPSSLYEPVFIIHIFPIL